MKEYQIVGRKIFRAAKMVYSSNQRFRAPLRYRGSMAWTVVGVDRHAARRHKVLICQAPSGRVRRRMSLTEYREEWEQID